jgi:sigma54-dependent transcription regulator
LAVRELFAVSQLQNASGNDADRLRKNFVRFGLKFEAIAGGS